MSFFIELFCVVTLQYQILVRIAIAYFIIEKKKAAPQPWQAIAQRFCSTYGCRANNSDICGNNSIQGICAFVSDDCICRKPSRAWKKQYIKLKEGDVND